jgi:hypothetical protein
MNPEYSYCPVVVNVLFNTVSSSDPAWQKVPVTFFNQKALALSSSIYPTIVPTALLTVPLIVLFNSSPEYSGDTIAESLVIATAL